MKKNEILEMQAIQRIFLHDAAQTLELDADDESIEGDNFGLVFDSHRQAIAVARLAVKNYLNEYDDDFQESQTKPVREVLPSVAINGKKYVASMDFLNNIR